MPGEILMSQILKTKYGTIERSFFKIDKIRYQQIIKKDHRGTIIEDKTHLFQKKSKHKISSFCYQYHHSKCEVHDCKCDCHNPYPIIF